MWGNIFHIGVHHTINYGTYIRPEKLLPEKKGKVVWPAMFFGGFKLQPENITTPKKRYSCLADG
jgi:hypothetical protein